jgi:hypothetical protein
MSTWSNTTDEGISPASLRRLEEAIDVASRMAGTDDIGAIHVTIAERPTYDELRQFREIAACHGLTLTMTAESIILRLKPNDPEVAAHAPALGVAALLPSLGGVAGQTWHRLHDRAARWNLGFQGLSEGTR